MSGLRAALVCVGLGMRLGAHLTPRARATLQSADVVFGLAGDALGEAWLQRLRPDVRPLHVHYAEGRSRLSSYAAMLADIQAELEQDRRVCVAVYGHPGVFAKVPHAAIAAARAAGYPASMEPAVSAADCLFADLGIDPGSTGCTHFEATQWLLHDRPFDPTAHLVLWQIGVVGDRGMSRGATGPAYRRLLVQRLSRFYPHDHPVVLYEAATHALHASRCEELPLHAVPERPVGQATTLVVRPLPQPRIPDPEIVAALDALDASPPAVPGQRGPQRAEHLTSIS